MSSVAQVLTTPEQRQASAALGARPRAALGYLRRNPSLGSGSSFFFALLLFVVIGHFTVDTIQFRPLSASRCNHRRGNFPSAVTSRAATSTRSWWRARR